MHGHFTMSSRTNTFYKHMYLNDQRRLLEHDSGLGKKQTRSDPILCTETPRDEVKDFNFSPPPAKHDDKYSKWKYPDVDVGMMAQLPSQKEKIAKIRQKELEYMEIINNSKIINSSLNQSAENTNRTDVNRNNQSSTRNTSRLSNTSRSQISNIDENDETSRSSRSICLDTNRNITNVNRPKTNLSKIDETDCYQSHVSDFKKVLNDNPGMLKIYRAKRAATFIEKQANAKYKSPIIYEDSNASSASTTRSNLSSNPDLNTLLHELKSTESQIQNLKLKVGLKSKTKSYERPTTHSALRRPSF